MVPLGPSFLSLSNREIRERWAKSPKVLAGNGINAKSRERVLSAWCVNSGVGQFRGRKRSSPCETLFELNLQRSLAGTASRQMS